jgi:gamma-glutamyltranspeptidase / glutathione hydrolase
MRHASLAFIAALLVTAGPAALAKQPVAQTRANVAAKGMVSAADPRAAEAGAEMLRQGGSAVDAAFATLLALNVVEPESQGIGGGSYLVYSVRGATPVTFDGREVAPRAATGTWFYKNGQPLSHEDAIPGGRSVGIPGNLRMMAMAHARYGKLPWSALFQPAIKLARDGFRITPRLYGSLDHSRRTGALSAEGREIFYQADGNPKPVGTFVKNPAFAAFLEGVARQGAESFYGGTNAQKIVATVNGSPVNPSRMTLADIASYKVVQRPPVCGTYRGYRICGMGPSSSGGTTVFETLKQLERFDLSALGAKSPVAWHLIAESMRLAYADREQYLGDPAYAKVPTAGLMDPAYLAKRSALISPDRSMSSVAAGRPAGAPELCTPAAQPEHGTSHFVAVDSSGNVASETSTIEDIFGSGLMVNGYYLNNELTDFNIVPGKNGCLTANRVAAGKRPRSSMSPTIVWDPRGHVRLAVGAAGGPTIPAQVLKAIIGVIDWHLSAQQAIALPVILAPVGDTVYVERGTYLEAMMPELEKLGHQVKAIPPGFKANAVEWVNGRWAGAADPRSEGAAVSQ